LRLARPRGLKSRILGRGGHGDDDRAGNGRPTSPLAEIEELVAASRERRDPQLERRLVRARYEAYAELDGTAPAPPPEPEERDLEPVEGIPAVEAAELSPGVLRHAILDSGCLLVRGLLPPEEAERLIGGIDRTLAAREAHEQGAQSEEDRAWYEPLRLPGVPHLERQRHWVTEASGVWAADSPRMAFELAELFRKSGLVDVMGVYLGARPAASVNKWTLRRVSPGGDAEWHQDGAFLGSGIRALNVWLALSRCGRDAPGLDIVPRRLDGVVEVGTDGARFSWSVSAKKAAGLLDGRPPARPEFLPGDALLFDELMLHQTAMAPGMTFDRYAVETWCFAPGAYPEKQVPLVL
jgi:hypothetical protein